MAHCARPPTGVVVRTHGGPRGHGRPRGPGPLGLVSRGTARSGRGRTDPGQTRAALMALHTRCRSMWRREVSRGDDHVVRPVRLARVVTGSAWLMFPYLFTRIPAFECRSASRPRQGVVHQLVAGHL